MAIVLSLGCKEKDKTSASPVAEPYAQKTIETKSEPELKHESVPPGSPLAESVRLRFGIYFVPTSKDVPGEVFKRLVRSSYKFLSFSVDQESGIVPFAVAKSPNISDFAPPSLETLKYTGHGLTSEDETSVQESREVFLVNFSLSSIEPSTHHREAMKLMAALAKKTGGLLWDESTGQLFSQSEWANRYKDWDLESTESWLLYTISSYKDGELRRMVTLGLEKFGLPDITVRGVSDGDTVGMAGLINLVIQTLRDGAKVDEDGLLSVDTNAVVGSWKILDGGKGSAKVTLAVGKRLEGDADNRLWEIVFPGGPDSELQTRQQAFLQNLFGATDEIVQSVHDEELEAASQRGLAKLAAMKDEFQKNWPVGDTLLVKSPFETDEGGKEWMWIEVVSWKDDEIKGILQNEPFSVTGLKAGARVESRFDLLFDYTREHADGTITGNGTGAIIGKRQQQ